MGEELDLKIDEMTQNTGKEESVTTSLCDRFGIHMYSDEFLENEVEYKKQQNVQKNQILQAVFHNRKQNTTSQYFQSVMDSSAETIVKKDYTEQNATNHYGMIAYLALGMVMAGIFYYFMGQRKKNENHNYNYTNQLHYRETV